MANRARSIIQGAHEALAIARGEADPAAFIVHVPETVDVQAIRMGLKLTQAAFAERFGLRLRTVQEWERGRSQPDHAVRAYLRVIEHQPDAVEAALRTATHRMAEA